MPEWILKFFEVSNINIKIVYGENYKILEELMKEDKIDLMVDNAYKKSPYKMLYKFAGGQIYIGGNKNSSDILENIDKVIEEYTSQKYNPIEKLNDKYFDEDYNKNLIKGLVLSIILSILFLTVIIKVIISKIKEKEPDYEQVLYNKYFKTFSSKIISLTEEEKEYIDNIGVLKGIYVDNVIPVEYYNTKTNEPDGIYVDISKLNYGKSRY